MKVAYVFNSAKQRVDYLFEEILLPQLETGCHGADVVVMFFVGDNTFLVQQGSLLGERVVDVAADREILLMLSGHCASMRGLATRTGTDESGQTRYETRNTFEEVTVGSFPDLYVIFEKAGVDQIVTL